MTGGQPTRRRPPAWVAAWIAAVACVPLASHAATGLPVETPDPPADAGAADAAFVRSLGIELENDAWTGDLEGMVKRRYVRVLVPYSKTLYFVDLGGRQRGISYDFMHQFEEHLNRKLGRTEVRVHTVFLPVPRDQLLRWLIDGRGDVVAANLTITPRRSAEVAFVEPAARGVKELLVTGPGAPPIRSLDDLANREVYVNKSTSYYEHLQALNVRLRARPAGHPDPGSPRALRDRGRAGNGECRPRATGRRRQLSRRVLGAGVS